MARKRLKSGEVILRTWTHLTRKDIPEGQIRMKLLGTDAEGKQSTRIVCLLVDDYRKLIENDASDATVPGTGDRTRK